VRDLTCKLCRAVHVRSKDTLQQSYLGWIKGFLTYIRLNTALEAQILLVVTVKREETAAFQVDPIRPSIGSIEMECVVLETELNVLSPSQLLVEFRHEFELFSGFFGVIAVY
jgi:hypothetical protein